MAHNIPEGEDLKRYYMNFVFAVGEPYPEKCGLYEIKNISMINPSTYVIEFDDYNTKGLKPLSDYLKAQKATLKEIAAQPIGWLFKPPYEKGVEK